MPRRPELRVLAAAALALGAAGCAPSEPQRATDAVHDLLEALARDDGAAACERLTHTGTSELLLTALEHDVRVPADIAERRAPCATIAARIPGVAGAARRLRGARVTRVIEHGEAATVHTTAGTFEAHERDGRWRVARFDALATALRRGGPQAADRVSLTVTHPAFDRPALGSTRALETTRGSVEIIGTLEPPGARIAARRLTGGRIEHASAADGRFRLVVDLRHGSNVLRVRATAPGRDPATVVLRLRRR